VRKKEEGCKKAVRLRGSRLKGKRGRRNHRTIGTIESSE